MHGPEILHNKNKDTFSNFIMYINKEAKQWGNFMRLVSGNIKNGSTTSSKVNQILCHFCLNWYHTENSTNNFSPAEMDFYKPLFRSPD
jgi:hypothetical protein